MTTDVQKAPATVVEPLVVTKPGVYDMDAATYHADPVKGGSLSNSGAKTLMPPGCPAKFAYEREHGRPPKREFDFGHLVHRELLGRGAEIVRVDTANWKTKAAQEQQAAAYAEGKTPVLEREYQVALEMVAVVRAHPLAGMLFEPGSGVPEQAMFWRCKATGVICRAMVDWLRHDRTPKLVIPDYKTANSASPVKIEKALEDFAYHRQAAWYVDGARTLGLSENPVFTLVVQEKTPPYLVTVAKPDHIALEAGVFYNLQARRLYAECAGSGRWPGYVDDETDAEIVPLPPYAQTRYFAESGQ